MTQKPGRPRKFSDEELHRRLIEAGIRALTEHGLSDGLATVRLDAAIAESGVPRRAAYRHLETDTGTLPQEELRRQVLLTIFRENPPGSGMEATAEFALKEVENHAEALASGDPVQIEAARRETCRRVGNYNSAMTSVLPWWAVFCAAASAGVTRQDRDPELMAAMQDSVEHMISHYSQLYEGMATLFHMELRPGITLREFALALLATSAGLNQIGSVQELPENRDPEPEGWTPLALSLDAMVNRCFVTRLPDASA